MDDAAARKYNELKAKYKEAVELANAHFQSAEHWRRLEKEAREIAQKDVGEEAAAIRRLTRDLEEARAMAESWKQVAADWEKLAKKRGLECQELRESLENVLFPEG